MTTTPSSTFSEQEFIDLLTTSLLTLKTRPNCVTGPGRAGAIASAYASIMLGIPHLPYKTRAPQHLQPLLIVSTTPLKKAIKFYQDAVTILPLQLTLPPCRPLWFERLPLVSPTKPIPQRSQQQQPVVMSNHQKSLIMAAASTKPTPKPKTYRPTVPNLEGMRA